MTRERKCPSMAQDRVGGTGSARMERNEAQWPKTQVDHLFMRSEPQAPLRTCKSEVDSVWGVLMWCCGGVLRWRFGESGFDLLALCGTSCRQECCRAEQFRVNEGCSQSDLLGSVVRREYGKKLRKSNIFSGCNRKCKEEKEERRT